MSESVNWYKIITEEGKKNQRRIKADTERRENYVLLHASRFVDCINRAYDEATIENPDVWIKYPKTPDGKIDVEYIKSFISDEKCHKAENNPFMEGDFSPKQLLVYCFSIMDSRLHSTIELRKNPHNFMQYHLHLRCRKNKPERKK